MRKSIITSLLILFLLLQGTNGFANGSFPDSIAVKVQSFYRHRSDKKPGRSLMLYFKGAPLIGKGTITLESGTIKELLPVDGKNGIDSLDVLLPAGLGVKTDCQLKIVVKQANKMLEHSVRVPALRQWTVYIYPHSHVDIGYTNTQQNVEVIHRRNIFNGIELAKKTAAYPEGARYVWNPEVLWPVERLFSKASRQVKQEVIDAVKKGYLHLDASYVNTNTSAAADEELFEFLGHGKDFEKLTGKKIETFVQVDVPGMTWGIVPVAKRLGIKYIFALNNGSDRVGRSTDLSFRPFWWKSVDGKSKVLFLQPGSYVPGAQLKGFKFWPKMLGQTDTTKLLSMVKTETPRQNFIDGYLADMLPKLEKSDYYPYDLFAMSWAMADNTPIDADLPEAVKSWNEEFAYPHLVIASATEIMKKYEEKYGDQLPVLSGDFTEYWTDGLGTAAKQTAMNRNAKERLIQDETLWAMLHQGEPAPRADLKEAWRNVSLGTEHTWCYFSPDKQPITNDILNVKFGYFQKGEDISKDIMHRALAPVAKSESQTVGVFNTLSWSRSQLVTLSKEQSSQYNSVTDEWGKAVLSQRLSTGELVFMAEHIPALGSGSYQLSAGKTNTSGSLAQGNVLDNGILKVVIDPQTGDISSLTKGAKEFVDAKAACSINSYRYLKSSEKQNRLSGTSNVKISILENGPLLASILVESAAEGCNSLSRTITLIKGQAYVDIKNNLDKQAITKKEGVHFGFAFNIPQSETMVDIPWGIMKIDKDQLEGANRNWIGFQRWLDVSNKEKGVTMCSLDAPVLEIGDLTADILGGATNSPKWIKNLAPSATIYSWALNNHWHTNFPLSQEGRLEFRYRLLPHNTAYDAAMANRFGMEQSQPLVVSPLKQKLNQKPLMSLTDNPKVLLSILKVDESGNRMEVRLRSVSDKDEVVKVNWLERKPLSVLMNNKVLSNADKLAQTEVLVPAMGMASFIVDFNSIISMGDNLSAGL
ncbi:glycoside hydrolase [Chitinophagaceae bacterium LB-8]|uniref:Glycoside hydrolase n=1 Tax=Paraflavisolibacter caeni TaxID=2982496 RepID=A0A9X2Y0C8_9BACT|nr:glycoside hydrolase family 38 C-terminal domain-containing protein [Paraflavisolibacter caeni]MCU7552241.1 glycoside hydrolase [Paraflavisolibacter caeni]